MLKIPSILLLVSISTLAFTAGLLMAADKDGVQSQKTYSCSLSEEELRAKLTPEQYKITRQNGTERPFANAYWNNKEEGIYVDIVSGEPLFSSRDKFDSGSGWPSFTKPIDPAALLEKRDTSHGMERTEVRSQSADSHLGHVFPDKDRAIGKYFCINSAALRFIPKEALEREGYGAYVKLFE